ncbi:hypothetical protein FS749_008629, partial [Ceratobasidium sp. UAMH 11750]
MSLSSPRSDNTDYLCRTYPFDAVVASIDMTRFRLCGWSSLVVGVIESRPIRGQDPTDCVMEPWMRSSDAFDHTNLVVFKKKASPVLITASPFAGQPMGKPLPDICDICPCSETEVGPASASNTTATKQWIVSHNGQDGHELRQLRMIVSCSSCHSTWTLPCHELQGQIRHLAD